VSDGSTSRRLPAAAVAVALALAIGTLAVLAGCSSGGKHGGHAATNLTNGLGQTTRSGSIAYWGDPQGTVLRFVDASGDAVGSVKTGLHSLVPLQPIPGGVVAVSGRTLLVVPDASHPRLVRFTLPPALDGAEVGGRGVTKPVGSRYAVLIAPKRTGAALLDLSDPRVTDLAAVAGSQAAYLDFALTPDERRLLVVANTGVWVVPTDDPLHPIRLASGNTAAMLSPNGSTVVLSSAGQIFTTDLDGGHRQTVANVAAQPFWVGGHLFADQNEVIGILEDSKFRPLMGIPDGVPTAFGHDRSILLASSGPAPNSKWSRIRTDGRVERVEALDGLSIADIGESYAIFGDGGGLSGNFTLLARVDDRGMVGPGVHTGTGFALASVSTDGRRVVLYPVLSTTARLMVVDLETGKTQHIAATGGSIAPDGSAVAAITSSGDLQIVPLFDDSKPIHVGKGLGAVWLPAS
jgi:hypothetical protein